jgi:hypothetical protein
LLLSDTSVRKLVAEFSPVRDHRTMVDYSIPRFVGSGYGFSLYTYVVGSEIDNPSAIMKERLEEYAGWGDAAAAIVPDPCQAARLDRAIRYRMAGRSAAPAAEESVEGCPPAGSSDSR